MANKITFKDRLVRKPFTYVRTIGTSTTKYEPSYGQVIQENMINATNLNNMQDNMIAQYDANRSGFINAVINNAGDVNSTDEFFDVSEYVNENGTRVLNGTNKYIHNNVLNFTVGEPLSFRTVEICETPYPSYTDVAQCNIVKFGGKLYCAIGTASAYYTAYFCVYDPDDGTWTQLSIGDSIRIGSASWLSASDTYIFASDYSYRYYLVRFDPSDNTSTYMSLSYYIGYGDVAWNRANDILYGVCPYSSSYSYCRRAIYSTDNGSTWSLIGSQSSAYMGYPKIVTLGNYSWALGSSYSSSYSQKTMTFTSSSVSYTSFSTYYTYRIQVCEDESGEFWWVFGASNNYTQASATYWYVHKWYGGSTTYDFDDAELYMTEERNNYSQPVMLNGFFYSLGDGVLVSSENIYESEIFY